MMKKSYLKNILIGFFSGLISGFFSAGGGLILLPYMTSLLKKDEVSARATTIFCIFFMVSTSGFFYLNKNFIDFSIALKCAIGGIIGGYVGSKILLGSKKNMLKASFIFFLIYAGIKMII